MSLKVFLSSLAVTAALALFPLRASATPVLVTVSSIGPNQFRISLKTVVAAPQKNVWEVLTDFDHHAQILPYISKSRIIRNTEMGPVVEQEGKIRVMFWTFTMHMTQQVKETSPQEMDFKTIAGDFTRLEGAWLLTEEKSTTQIACQFVVQPKRRVPEWAIRYTARHYLVRMVESLTEHARQDRGLHNED